MCNVYRRFTVDFAKTAKPLNDFNSVKLPKLLRQPPKHALVSRSYCGLPGYFQEYLCGDRLVSLYLRHALLYEGAVITCTCISRGAPFGAELGEILVGSLRGVAICGPCHCVGGGVPPGR